MGNESDIKSGSLRRSAEEDLKESEKRFRMLADNLPDVIVRFDMQLRHVYVNRQAELTSGRPVSEYLGKTNRELGLPEDLVKFWEAASKKAISTRQKVDIDFDFETPTGTRHFESQVIPELDEHGEPIFLLSVTRDITSQKRLTERNTVAQAETARLLAEAESARLALLSVVADQQKTEEIMASQLSELQRWHEATLGREKRVMELKTEINQLLNRSGQPSRYTSVETDDAPLG